MVAHRSFKLSLHLCSGSDIVVMDQTNERDEEQRQFRSDDDLADKQNEKKKNSKRNRAIQTTEIGNRFYTLHNIDFLLPQQFFLLQVFQSFVDSILYTFV